MGAEQSDIINAEGFDLVKQTEKIGYPSLTQVSNEMMNYPNVCEKYGIILGVQNHGMPFVSARFPEGWKCVNEEDARHATYYDPNGIPVFRMFIKFTSYDKYSSVSLLLDEDVMEIREKEMKNESIIQLYNSEWTKEYSYILFDYKDNQRAYDSYFSGCDNSRRGLKSEFDGHKLIGFTNSYENAEKIATMHKNTDKYATIIARYLPDGLDNLDRFERKHITGIDMNLVERNGGKIYCYAAYCPKYAPIEQRIF